MNCIKCGNEIAEGQAFCESCLEGMKAYPVNPGTPIQLPQRKSAPAEKKRPQKAAPTPEQIIKQQRKWVRWLLLICTTLSILVALLTVMLLDLLNVISLSDLLALVKF